MTCDAVAAHLVDPSVPAPHGLVSHLASCPDCRALARAHRAALALQDRLPVPPAAPVDLDAVHRTVARRRTRRSLAVVGLSAAAALVLLVRVAPSRTALPAPQPAPEPPVVSIGELLDEVRSYSHRDVSVNDPAYASFGALSEWVAPPRSHAVATSPYREALRPISQQEDVL
jgi:hypothetical protein